MFRSFRWIILIGTLVFFSHFLLQSTHKRRLVLLGWPNCLASELLELFEKEFDCQVIYSLFESNEEMYTRIKNGGIGYDMVFCSSYFIELMQDQGLLRRLNHKKIPNISYIDRDYLTCSPDPDMIYSIPQIIGILGIGFDKGKCPNRPDSWFVFSRWSHFKKRMTLLNDPKDTLGTALLALGYKHNTTDPYQVETAKKLLLQWKENIALFSNEPYMGLESGEFVLSQAYLGEILKTQNTNKAIDFLIPKEGSMITFDNLALLKSSAQEDLALSFIDFILRPENVARNIAIHFGFIPHTGLNLYLKPEFLQTFRKHYLNVIERNKSPVVTWLKESEGLYLSAWEEVRSSN
ncbi:polyamine ABC transporter substrate-binding protein [Candidatus Similichlamydia laticola]|uniref:ABC transporter, periplasmic spermidine putrescine-binding protein PotD n=1 Tax=Candidatus Similichlamydia laticola TaxID=2170265 RepID=A0A369KFS4_9BACT|nr:spermidine/putrescine ABC transporter substrate-binding protein [Candidatus Similichlamydia laticola]RDB31555.1 ABC transporter, periplasmic spermidine putrescine-binding protein PotD [Candidatus Similichlamydia laticola]